MQRVRWFQHMLPSKTILGKSWYDDRTYVSDGTDGNPIGEVIRWFPDGSDISIIQDIDSPNGVPDIVDTGGQDAMEPYMV